MLLVLAAGLLLIAVALLILRPLLAPADRDRSTLPGVGTHPPADRRASGDGVVDPGPATAVDPAADDALEAAIAARRARMSERAGGER